NGRTGYHAAERQHSRGADCDVTRATTFRRAKWGRRLERSHGHCGWQTRSVARAHRNLSPRRSPFDGRCAAFASGRRCARAQAGFPYAQRLRPLLWGAARCRRGLRSRAGGGPRRSRRRRTGAPPAGDGTGSARSGIAGLLRAGHHRVMGAMVAVGEIAEFLREFAPLELAESWDNVGLLLGRTEAPVRELMTCLTVTPDTVREAVEQRAGLIVTHHPFPFRPLKQITSETIVGRLLLELAEARVAVYSPH